MRMSSSTMPFLFPNSLGSAICASSERQPFLREPDISTAPVEKPRRKMADRGAEGTPAPQTHIHLPKHPLRSRRSGAHLQSPRRRYRLPFISTSISLKTSPHTKTSHKPVQVPRKPPQTHPSSIVNINTFLPEPANLTSTRPSANIRKATRGVQSRRKPPSVPMRCLSPATHTHTHRQIDR